MTQKNPDFNICLKRTLNYFLKTVVGNLEDIFTFLCREATGSHANYCCLRFRVEAKMKLGQ
jgi:hypothetical protein